MFLLTVSVGVCKHMKVCSELKTIPRCVLCLCRVMSGLLELKGNKDRRE